MADPVGREAESAAIAEFARVLAEGPRGLLVRGAAGIGKTTVWRHGVDRCREAGLQVLVTRPAEEETAFALVGLADLFERVEVEPAVLAAEAEPLARGRAVLAALRGLAENRPVVLA